MAFPISGAPNDGTPASPAYAGTFIPEIWSGKLIEKFYDATVLAAIANTDYQGEIKNQGDTVKIRTKPSITINTYEDGQTLSAERPSSNIVELQIDKGKYFNTILDDVMEVQADINMMSMWADDASEQMKIEIDTDVLAGLSAGISADNVGNTAGRISNNIGLGITTAALELVSRSPGVGEIEIIDFIIRMGQVLDEQNIPETGRWIILPAWACAMIKRSELRDASLTGDSGGTMLRNGRLGMIDRFTIYMSNLVPFVEAGGGNDTTAHRVFAGHSHGLTFASQLTKVETLRGESAFGTYLRGLQIYGFKIVDGTALAMGIVKKA